MAFEDRYFKFMEYGLLNIRYRPNDPSLMPIVAVSDAANTPGRFCLAKVSVRYGYSLKKCIPAQKFSDMKPVLLSELRVSLAYIKRDLDKTLVRAEALDAMDHPEVACRAALVSKNEPLLTAQREIMEIVDAVSNWTYEENLCTAVTLANCVK